MLRPYCSVIPGKLYPASARLGKTGKDSRTVTVVPGECAAPSILHSSFGSLRRKSPDHEALLLGFGLPCVFVIAIPVVGCVGWFVAQAAVGALFVELAGPNLAELLFEKSFLQQHVADDRKLTGSREKLAEEGGNEDGNDDGSAVIRKRVGGAGNSAAGGTSVAINPATVAGA